MAKESKKKVKLKASPSPNYVTSDDDNTLPSELVKNSNTMIKGLMR
jgi:hypothetical protein